MSSALAHDEENVEMIMSLSSTYLSKLQMNLLTFALSLRSYSARVQMFNQVCVHDGNGVLNELVTRSCEDFCLSVTLDFVNVMLNHCLIF